MILDLGSCDLKFYYLSFFVLPTPSPPPGHQEVYVIMFFLLYIEHG